MVSGNGRLSYLIEKSHIFHREMANCRPIIARGVLNDLFSDFLPIRLTKD